MFLAREEQEKADHEMAMEIDRNNRDQLLEEQRPRRVSRGRVLRARSYSPTARRTYDKRPLNDEGLASPNKRRRLADGDYVPRGRNVGADPVKV